MSDPKSLSASLGASLRASIARDGAAGARPTDRRQGIVLLLDTSSSLADGNAIAAVQDGASAFAREFALAEHRALFEIAIVQFASTVSVLMALSPATTVTVPPLTASGVTALGPALAKAHELLRPTLALPKRVRPVVVVFSDGEANEGGDPGPVADALKLDADIITIGLGKVNRVELEAIATSPAHAHYAADPKALRHLFASVGRTLSQSRGALAGLLSSRERAAASIDPFASRKR